MDNLSDFDYEYYLGRCQQKLHDFIYKDLNIIKIKPDHAEINGLDFTDLSIMLNSALKDMVGYGLLTLDDKDREGLIRIREQAIQKANDSVKEKIAKKNITVGEANQYMTVYLEQFKESLEEVKYDHENPRTKLR